MTKRYGTPYKGSKNQIAEWVYSHFPKATNFYDLFAGGCAITQIALMKSEYKNYFCNDIDNDGIKLFLDAIHGKFKDETRWISRDDFFRLKDKEPYVRYCWSFGNHGRSYLYSKEIEPYKKAWHYAITENDFSFAEKMGIDLSEIRDIQGITDRYLKSKKILKKHYNSENYTRCIEIERAQQLESLNRLQSLQSLQSSNLSYDEVKIHKDSVIFCDIPYVNTDRYGRKNDNIGFDHDKFYEWCGKQTELVLISEYQMTDEFICIDKIKKRSLICSDASKCTDREEKIFIPKHQEGLYKELMGRPKSGELDFGEVA